MGLLLFYPTSKITDKSGKQKDKYGQAAHIATQVALPCSPKNKSYDASEKF